MEAQRSSKKRKQRPSNPLAGIFTRSKSQRYFHHCNRSGKFRPDPVGKTRPIQPPPPSISNPKVPICQRSNNVDEISHISIKDLRARRVFSQPRDGFGKNINPNCDSEVVICKSNESDGKPDGFGAYVETPSLLVSEKCDSEVDFKDKGSNGRNPNLSKNCDLGVYSGDKGSIDGTPNSTNESIATSASEDGGVGLSSGGGEILKPQKDEKFDVGLVCSGSVPDSMSPNLSDKELKGGKCENSEGLTEETLQTTPPDAVILVRQTDDPNVINGNTASSLASKQVSPSKDDGRKTNSNMKRNSGLKPCSRPRVFRAPNSFSYRRLLPYLMDLAKDTSSPLKLNTYPKSENGVEEKPLLSSSQDSLPNSLKEDDKQVTIVPICTIIEVSNGAKEERKLHQASMEIPIDSSHGISQAHLVSDNLEKLGDDIPVVQSNFAPFSYIPKGNHEAPAKEATVEAQCSLSLVEFKTEENSISMFHSSSKAGALVSASVPVGLAKGILKKNPRGCRGICNCLNCASFRLNAEKAFDFSRNQLLDAQELAQDLMKELSDLRSMLEKSVNGANSIATIPVNQVQEACRRASNVEDIARSRLSQMNEDLYVHCRTKPLQRPRVNFSIDVKEKVIWEAK